MAKPLSFLNVWKTAKGKVWELINFYDRGMMTPSNLGNYKYAEEVMELLKIGPKRRRQLLGN